MSGWFQRLFAPRWRHPDPRIRAQAVSRLDTSRDADRHALERLAIDPDPEVRRQALSHYQDPAELMALHAQGQTSPQLQQRLLYLLVGRDSPRPLADRLALVERLETPDLLEAVALEGDNQELRLAALGRINDEESLIRQACDNGIAAVRHAAAERIQSEAGLARLAREARRDKHVARLARERLNQLRTDAAQRAEAQEARERILTSLEAHGRHAWEPLYAGRYRHLQREWEGLGDHPSAEQERRYQEACLLCRKTLSDHEAQQHVHAAADRQREDDYQARLSLIASLEESLEGLQKSERLGSQDIDSLHAQKCLLASRWQLLSDAHTPDEALRRRYDHALESYERVGRAWERYTQQAEALRAALDKDNREPLRDALARCDWPEDLPPPGLVAEARHYLAHQESAETADLSVRMEAFVTDLEELETLVQRGAFKSASRLHQSLRHRADQLSEAQLKPHRAALKRLGAQLAELRDWRGFVAGPKRDQLCQAITELADDETLNDAELDRRHRQLVKEWKSLGDAAADRDLSARFRAASDRLHERLAAWHEARNQQRERNLEARQALCEQLEALLDQPDPSSDPDALRDIRDRAREQWRRHSPVPRDHAEAIGHRFGRIRNGLQALIDRRAQEIANAKRDLIEEARALQESPQSASQVAEQAKRLQQQWRTLGRAPKGEEQVLWREFRGVCDAIFANREAERDNRAQRAKSRLDDMQALIDQLDAWQPEASHEHTRLEQAVAEAEAMEPLPPGRRSDGMRRRWHGIVRARREQLNRLAVSEEVMRWKAFQPLLDAHLAADEAMLNGEPAEDVTADASVTGDMHEAHQRRNAARRHPSEPTQVEESLVRLRVYLALLAGSQVSPRDDPLRLAIQVERLNERVGRELSRSEELHEVLREIFATGPVSQPLWEREAVELDPLLTRLLQAPGH
ncbi:DUF349 domain-containing protein [Litchfieldella xinjiangensis]|uniref:DUF349 domain-containing protein n=1 Tax=Litchfieldella xinjiangensis TaxID=1166948 RepID=UPI0005BC1C1E|nr:DUF349 domain-containing protein [Halomonas xinjiangensis]